MSFHFGIVDFLLFDFHIGRQHFWAINSHVSSLIAIFTFDTGTNVTIVVKPLLAISAVFLSGQFFGFIVISIVFGGLFVNAGEV